MIRYMLQVILLILIALSSTGCSSLPWNKKKKTGFNFALEGSAAGAAHKDNRWRAEHLLNEALNCMRSKSGQDLKKPGGKFRLILDNPHRWSNGFPEIFHPDYTPKGWRLYGLAWREGGVYVMRLAHAGNGYAHVAIQRHEAGHWVEFKNNKPAHWGVVRDCFSGTFWRNAAASVTNLLPGPDKPLIKKDELIQADGLQHKFVEIDADGDGDKELVLITFQDLSTGGNLPDLLPEEGINNTQVDPPGSPE